MAFKDQDIPPGERLAARLRAVMAIDPGAHVLEFERSWWPWSMLGESVSELDSFMSASGLPAGCPMGIVMRNRPETVRAVAAALATNRCVVTLNPATPPHVLAEEIRHLRLPLVAMCAADWAMHRDVAQAGGTALRIGASGSPLIDDAAEVRVDTPPTLPGVAVQMLTSGTTGAPKRINITYASLEHEIDSTASYGNSENLAEIRLRSGVGILWAPLVHIGGMRSLISSLVAGRKIALLERFTVEDWRDLVVRHRPRVVSLAPTAMRMVLDASVPESTFEGVRAVVSGTAPVPPELAEEFHARYGVPVLVVYGATEFAGGVAGWTLRDWEKYGTSKRGSVGKANTGVSVRVVDAASGLAVPCGEEGVLEVSGPQLGRDGWVRTTDLGRMDEDGFIWVLGRADDVIIRGGFKVSGSKVREILMSHPMVTDAAVVGIPDERLGSVPVAAVELKVGNDGSTDEDDLRRYLKDRLNPYQVPVAVRIVEALPRSVSMKVNQPEVKRMFLVGQQ